jgi:hypothetical protein
MSDEPRVDWDNLRCLYAEDLKRQRLTLTISAVRDTPKGARLFCHNEESEAWDVAFAAKGKDGKTPYIQIPKPNAYGKATGLLRTYKMAMGGEPCGEHAGHKLVLYPVKSLKSQTGQAIRIAVQEGAA